ncbi:flavin-containing monooxygenase [Kitasatospora sp. NPDC058162]|uniref:flavin-containing monooxygenase n=1 Tax=Kitasatospora sp. NPDC058162 TaxID=3346362 RepID=UPI0036D886D6
MGVLVVGAGLSGLAAVIALRRAGFDDLVVLEKAERLGGTWRDNTYPGCGCDVPSFLYEYSFAPHSWTRTFATQPEILRYLQDTAAGHGADDAIRYGAEVRACTWDQPSRRWLVTTTAGPYAARSLVLATGPWSRPRYPDIPGLTDFPGAVFHSARWEHDAELTGRRIAVVGNAASTVQFLPELQRRGAHVDVFQSTAPWVLPKPDYPVPSTVRSLLERWPTGRRLVRGMHHWTQEAIGLALRHPWLLPPLEAGARLHLRLCVRDRALRRALTPSHRLGARRLLTSDTYFPALSAPNVSLHPTRVERVEGSTVVGADGRRVDADVIVLATGFRIGDTPVSRHVYGRQGRTLHQTWQEGRRAYLGTSVSGYPNLFLLLGPNILNGNVAVPVVLEAQLRYITDALTHLHRGEHAAMEVRPEVEEAYNTALQAALSTTVYNTAGPSGYYFSPAGVNTFCWPWSTRRLQRQLHAFDPQRYTWCPPQGVNVPPQDRAGGGPQQRRRLPGPRGGTVTGRSSARRDEEVT